MDRRLCIAADGRGTRSSELKSREKAFHERDSTDNSLEQTEAPIRECTQSGMDAGCNLHERAGFSQVINQDFGGEADVHTIALAVRIRQSSHSSASRLLRDRISQANTSQPGSGASRL